MNSKTELKNHILYEFFAGSPNRENILFESRGVVNGLGRVVMEICKDIEEQVKDTCKKKIEITRSYNGKLSEMGLSSFFNYYLLEITTRYNGYKDDCEYKGGFVPARSLSDTANGIVCTPWIEYYVLGNNVEQIMNVIRTGIGHELTHAYNLLMYGNKNNLSVKEVINNYRFGQRYHDIQLVRDNETGNKRAIAYILYHLNRMERNAYIAELKQELEAKADAIIDSESAWRAVLESESYKKFKFLERNVKIMHEFLPVEIETELLDATNEITGKNFKSYNQMKKYYAAYWGTWKKKYLSTAAKIAYDVFEENNVMVDGCPNIEPLIRDRHNKTGKL